MLSPSDFNSAVPQFTNGDYASNPINPQYIAEPSAEDYNRGSEPLQTLPAQWWNWFLNKFTNRFNKVNIYVKNIFNELTQLLSLVSVTPSGTEGTPTVGQLKDMFETKYPDYLKTAPALSNTYVPQTTKVNGHALSGNITITCVACAGANGSGTAFGTAATVNTGTAVGCIPTVGTALGTTDGQFLATDATGKLKPSGYSASSFRSSSWTPTLVACACYGKNGNSYSAFGSNAFNSTAFTTCTGTVTQVKVGNTAYNPSSGVISLPAYPSIPTCVACASCNGSGVAFGNSATKGVFGRADVGDIGWGTAANQSKVVQVCAIAYWNGAYTGTSSNLRYYCGGAFGSAAGKDAGNASGTVPLIGTALSTIDNTIVLTDANGKLKPSPYTIGDSAYKTAGSAIGNVPVVGTALGSTNGQFIATDASGKLKPSGYTASSFLGSTAKACCAGVADSACNICKTTSNITCYVYISSANASIVRLGASCGNNSRNLMVNCADCAINAQCSEAIVKCSNAICICARKVNYACSYWLCNRCNFDVLFTPIIDTVNDCHMEYSTIKKFMGTIIPAKAECWVGTFDSCIGQWSTCYPGIRVV